MNKEKRKKYEKNMRRIIDTFLSKQLPDNEKIFGLINVSEIVLSPDSSYLDFKVSCFQNQDLLTKTLAKYAHIIQKTIGKELSMRINPRVRFRYDDTGEIGAKVTDKINKIDMVSLEQKITHAE